LLYADDGSVNIEIDTEGKGAHTPDGYLRVKTTDYDAPGVYATDGALQAVLDPEDGTGVYDATNNVLRMSTADGEGRYDSTGALRVTVTNPPEEDPEE
jgi:hypothetical protein